jgi:AcrR family transcriptional regulator
MAATEEGSIVTNLAPRRPKPVTPPPLPHDLTASQRARRDRIVQAGLDLLRSREYDQIQMKEVAEEAGVALGTVYRYFQSKEHLFAESFARWASWLGDNVARRPLQGSTNVERLTDVLHRSLRAFQGRPQLARVVVTLETSSDAFATEIFLRQNARTRRIYTAALGDVPAAVAETVITVAGAVLDLGLRQWVMGRQTITEVYDSITTAVEVLLNYAEPEPELDEDRAATFAEPTDR